MKYCSHCGSPMDDDMRFCQQCGTKFRDTLGNTSSEDRLVDHDQSHIDSSNIVTSSTPNDIISKQILELVKNVKDLDLSQLKSVRESLDKISKNKLVSSSKKIRDLLNASIATVDEQIFIKEEAIRIKRELELEEARIRKAKSELAKAKRKQKIASFINSHPNEYVYIDRSTNNIVPSKKLILCAVILVVSFSLLLCLNMNLSGETLSSNDADNTIQSDDNFSEQSDDDITSEIIEQSSTDPQVLLNKINIKIKCAPNLFFNTYDLDVTLNDEVYGGIEHGDTETFQFELEDGTHTLVFSKKDDPSVKGQVSFSIADDTDIEYKTTCYTDEVRVTQEHYEIMRPLTENEAKTPGDYKKYLDEPYETVVNAFKSVGFTNITLVELRDLEDYEDSYIGDVASVSIGGRTEFNSGEILEKNTEIIVTYHIMEPTEDEMNALINNRNGEAAADILSSFDGTGYTIICYVQDEEIIDFNPQGYIFVSGTINHSKKHAHLNFTTQELIDIANALEEYLPQETAKRAAVVAMTNCQATDVFNTDGSTYNISKFHKYSDISGFYLSVVNSGKWSAKDEQTWHVSDIKFMLSGYTTYLKASMDITFDGKNYIVSNVDKTIASKDYIDSSDPTKVNIEHLEPTKHTPYLTVAQKLVAEDRDYAAEQARNNKTMPTSTRTNWVDSQFSLWNGEHKELKNLIKNNLNDEKSYDHINTTYYDLMSQEQVDSVNKILKSAGYSKRVEIGDLFIMCEFSAKNAFNATVKNTAYAIVYYDEDVIELIGVE